MWFDRIEKVEINKTENIGLLHIFQMSL